MGAGQGIQECPLWCWGIGCHITGAGVIAIRSYKDDYLIRWAHDASEFIGAYIGGGIPRGPSIVNRNTCASRTSVDGWRAREQSEVTASRVDKECCGNSGCTEVVPNGVAAGVVEDDRVEGGVPSGVTITDVILDVVVVTAEASPDNNTFCPVIDNSIEGDGVVGPEGTSTTQSDSRP